MPVSRHPRGSEPGGRVGLPTLHGARRVAGVWPACGHLLGAGPGIDQAVPWAAACAAECGHLLGGGPGIDQASVRRGRVACDSGWPHAAGIA